MKMKLIKQCQTAVNLNEISFSVVERFRINLNKSFGALIIYASGFRWIEYRNENLMISAVLRMITEYLLKNIHHNANDGYFHEAGTEHDVLDEKYQIYRFQRAA